jgi:hypothetical protein
MNKRYGKHEVLVNDAGVGAASMRSSNRMCHFHPITVNTPPNEASLPESR